MLSNVDATEVEMASGDSGVRGVDQRAGRSATPRWSESTEGCGKMSTQQNNGNSRWMERLKKVNQDLKDALQSPTGKHAVRFLQEELGRMNGPGSLTPNQAQLLSPRIDQALGQMIAAFAPSRNPLDWFGNRQPLRLEMALHRIAGIVTHLEAVIAEYNALTRGALLPSRSGRSGSEPTETRTNTLSTLAARRPSPAQCRRVAERLHELETHAVAAARDIQQSVRGAHSTNPFDVTGAVAELVILASWLRNQQITLLAELWGTTNGGAPAIEEPSFPD